MFKNIFTRSYLGHDTMISRFPIRIKNSENVRNTPTVNYGRDVNFSS